MRFEAGNPAENEADFVVGRAQMTLDVKAENGVIEIIQQAGNYVHREGGGHMNICFGSPKIIQTYLALTYGPETMIIGLFFCPLSCSFSAVHYAAKLQAKLNIFIVMSDMDGAFWCHSN